MRINKYLADHGYGSRREADRLIESGKVTINGRKAKLGDQVEETDEILVAGRAQQDKPKPVYLLFHKPVGLITTTDTTKKDNVISFIHFPERLFPVGRLDVESSGLLLLTNDGDLANKLMHPRYEHEKEYEIDVKKPISDVDLKKLARGVDIGDGMTLPAQTKRLSPKSFSITIREGRHRQIRRMCEAIGHDVAMLKRTRVATISLGDLAPGTWRHLSSPEVHFLQLSLK